MGIQHSGTLEKQKAKLCATYSSERQKATRQGHTGVCTVGQRNMELCHGTERGQLWMAREVVVARFC